MRLLPIDMFVTWRTHSCVPRRHSCRCMASQTRASRQVSTRHATSARATLTVTALLVSGLALAGSDDWPGWRGPTANGISPLKDVPSSWSAERNVAWKTPLEGRGHSSPVVWGDRIFLTTDIQGEAVTGIVPPKHILRGEPFRQPDSTGMDHK